MYIHERISALLSEKSLSQKNLAEATGIAASAISDWKKKNTNPSAEAIIRISEFFNISTDYLLTGSNKEDSTNLPKGLNMREEELLAAFKKLNDSNQHFIIGKTFYQLDQQMRNAKLSDEQNDAIERLFAKSFTNKDKKRIAEYSNSLEDGEKYTDDENSGIE